MQGTVCLGFVDMEKAFDSLKRKAMAILHWLEAWIRMVKVSP